jgi:glycosyltransferase involved in cell wall biosynthesis
MKQPCKSPLRVALLLRDFGIGGTQRQFLELAAVLQERGHYSVVLLSAYGGDLEDELRLRKISYRILNKQGPWDFFSFLWRLQKAVREEKVGILYGSLLTQNLWAAMVRLFHPRVRLVFGFRNTGYDTAERGFFVRCAEVLEGILFRVGKTPIIVNSHAGIDLLRNRHVRDARLHLIPNGIHPERAQYTEKGRKEWRVRLGLNDRDILIGSLSSGRQAKDLSGLLSVCLSLRELHALPLHLFLVGPSAEEQKSLFALAGTTIGNKFLHVVTFQKNISACLSAMDVFVLNARSGEGTSNALLEAICCERLCIATDVGDAREILQQHGKLIPADAPGKLAEAIVECSRSLERTVLSSVRTQLLERYSIDILAEKTEKIFTWTSCD